MPSYDYRCTKCKKQFTAILSIGEHDAGKVKCPKCGDSKVEQLITAFQVKTSRKSQGMDEKTLTDFLPSALVTVPIHVSTLS